jgi:hypothetical protein
VTGYRSAGFYLRFCCENQRLTSTRTSYGSRLRPMNLFSNKALRLLLAISVSIWMAGGCLFGCANTAMGAEVAQSSANVVDAGNSCHAKRSHDCCSAAARPKTKKSVASNLKPRLAGVPSFVPAPRGMMNECPLVVNSTAITSKNSTHVPDPGRAPVAALPIFEKQIEHVDHTLAASFVPNRGPTHLRCCVFLI